MPIQHVALSIAGFDGSGGAGIQADLKAFSALGCYGMTVLTALPVQNTCGVKSCYEIPVQAVTGQLQTLFEDIRPHSIKIGMLYSEEIITAVADFLKQHAQGIPVVLDPVAVAKSGAPLLLPEAVNALKTTMLPLATLVTPNLPEAQTLTGKAIKSAGEMPEVAALLQAMGAKNVLIKGGHLNEGNARDLLLNQEGELQWFTGPRIQSKNTHGTGCTLSAAIAANLARGLELADACADAKQYLSLAIESASQQSVGKGHGPVHHFFQWW
ncbi:bifunctional hydroxymethylpyrimidine kinase/phosphomethylpyrimidine kinase [Legionella dresdenensis]|uniref:hydroxymethylpyrimidine kinase n=1 Tax=Legionella dresdenensis TaxID=450200 RepID=A0ABV8CF53_9GAMM